jgi:uncharacterized protein
MGDLIKIGYPNHSSFLALSIMRFFFIALFIWLAIVVVRRYLNRASRLRKQPTRIGTMVRCDVCGLHVPETEALKKHDKYYCSVQHRDGIENRAP